MSYIFSKKITSALKLISVLFVYIFVYILQRRDSRDSPTYSTVSAQIRGRRLIKKLGFYGEILLNKTLSNLQILQNKELAWWLNQEWPLICADTVIVVVPCLRD